MLNPNQKHFEILSDDFQEGKTVNLEQLLLEQSKNNINEMFVILIANLFERRLLTKNDLADMVGVSHSQLEEWNW